MEILSKCDRYTLRAKEILEVSAYFIETRVALVRSGKINLISKIIHYSFKNQAFQTYYIILALEVGILTRSTLQA